MSEELAVPIGQELEVEDSGVNFEDLRRSYWASATTGGDGNYYYHTVYFPPAVATEYWSAVVDMTGDGRRDLVFYRDGDLRLSENIGSVSEHEYADPVDLFGEGNFVLSEVGNGKLPLKLQISFDLIGSSGTAMSSVDYIGLQDVNRDGRTDVVDARNPGHWIIYLNRPSGGSALIYWEKIEAPVNYLVEEWRARVSVGDSGSGFENGWISGARFPLSWTLSGIEMAEARAYKFSGLSLDCSYLSPLFPLEYPGQACAWERKPSKDVAWTVDGSPRSYKIIALRGVDDDAVLDVAGVEWSPGFRFVRGWEPEELRIAVQEPECRDLEPFGQDCEPDVFVAPAKTPWNHYAGFHPGPGEVVLPKPESLNSDSLTQIEVELREEYDRYIGCFENGNLYCAALEIQAYQECYSWYGGRRGDLKPGDGYDCLVEDSSTRWRGYSRGIRPVSGLPASP
ncbi:hypothetical protein [Microbulbifer taiwanensis]